MFRIWGPKITVIKSPNMIGIKGVIHWKMVELRGLHQKKGFIFVFYVYGPCNEVSNILLYLKGLVNIIATFLLKE